MKGKLFITIYLCMIILLIIPYLLWEMSAEKELEVLIINKTVPDQSYMNHKGVVWALNYSKYTKANEEHYDVAKDFAGVEPLGTSEYSIKPIEEFPASEYNLIYIADTYGVYEETINGENPQQKSPSLIYGGITMEEITSIKNIVFKNQTTLVAEFNSFADPTGLEARQELTNLLGVKWTGWIGRYFDELNPEKNNEIDLSMVSNYEKQTGGAWKFQEGGLILIKEDGEIIILEESKDFDGMGVEFTFTEKGKEFFGKSITAQYNSWFDILAAEEAETMANYNLNLTEEGVEKLRNYNIPSVFPAVTRSITYGLSAYYFAGDYALSQGIPSFYKYKGLDIILRSLSSFQRNDSDDFYYHAFMPMMDKILDESFRNKQDQSVKEIEEFEEDGIAYNNRVNHDVLETYQEGQWEEVTIKGVNMGIAKPGVWPGEAAISFEEYFRWMNQISEMGANTIRVYTIHPPEFYQALWLHNQNNEKQLYVMHGIWITEEILEETHDALMPQNTLPFEQEMKDAVDVIHGNAVLKDLSGHASGDYSVDVSPYVSAWILGIEWSPSMVKNTNKVNKDLAEFQGNYFYTENGEAFEKWLAARMDYITAYESENYGKQRLVSFANWPPTDLLDHPVEPFLEEDMVSVNPNSIHPKESLKTGYFASYHVYPYYPEFLNYDEQYLNFIDHRGEKNNYAGYLNALIEAHDMPVLIAEFGVPASRGKAHNNPFGWNQGNLSEKEQGEIGIRLFEDLLAQGAVGGIVFTWQDEWFKRTWNTMQLDNPARRPYWSNVQTNEQRFGLLSFDSNKKPLDGNREKWETEYMLYENDKEELKTLFMDHDEAYLYLMMEYEVETNQMEEMDLYVFLNTIQGQGNKTISFVQDASFEEGIDFVIEITGEEGQSRVWVDQYYDPFYFQYGFGLKILANNKKMDNNTGIFNPVNLALSGSFLIPTTQIEVPFSSYETGKLEKSLGGTETRGADSLADYYVNQEDGLIEMRIPWMLLNFKDPSQKEVLGDLWETGLAGSQFVDSIEVGVGIGHNGTLLSTIPGRENGALQQELIAYQWDNWERPNNKETLKASYYIFQEFFLKDEMKFKQE
jgi:hypothetical protein